jgi:hypothetical protein
MSDYLTREGANQIAHVIQEYWAKRGKKVSLTIEEFRTDRKDRNGSTSGPLYGIRSNMINGTPVS